MTEPPTIVLVHGPFAESASWNPVISKLRHHATPLVGTHRPHFADIVAIANPLRRLHSDAAYLREVIDDLGGPVVLVGHSYGGSVITEAAAHNDAVVGLVYVAAFAPHSGESASRLVDADPASGLADSLRYRSAGRHGDEVTVRPSRYRDLLADDLRVEDVALMSTTQRPVTHAALGDRLRTPEPAWQQRPSRFVFGGRDRVIPVEVHRHMARRAGATDIVEVNAASHFVMLSHPTVVASSILAAAADVQLPVAS